jgi:hypothetical protein
MMRLQAPFGIGLGKQNHTCNVLKSFFPGLLLAMPAVGTANSSRVR